MGAGVPGGPGILRRQFSTSKLANSAIYLVQAGVFVPQGDVRASRQRSGEDKISWVMPLVPSRRVR